MSYRTLLGIALLSRGLVERFHGPGASNALLAIGVSLVVVALAGLRGLLSVTPGEAVVLRLAGSYHGTVRDPEVHNALARWAGDEFRSTNSQIEFLLRHALVDAGRLPSVKPSRRSRSIRA